MRLKSGFADAGELWWVFGCTEVYEDLKRRGSYLYYI